MCLIFCISNQLLAVIILGCVWKWWRIPDPEEIEQSIEREMRKQVEHNPATGMIRLTGDDHFPYSKRGLIFLWVRFLKDMVRFC